MFPLSILYSFRENSRKERDKLTNSWNYFYQGGHLLLHWVFFIHLFLVRLSLNKLTRLEDSRNSVDSLIQQG